MFCYPEHIDSEMRKLFDQLARERFLRGLAPAEFAMLAARLIAESNAIHPFREGNGRAQLAYLTLLAANAGHPLALERLSPGAMLTAMIASFKSDDAPLAELISGLVSPAR
jgi:cell filamentation protein